MGEVNKLWGTRLLAAYPTAWVLDLFDDASYLHD